MKLLVPILFVVIISWWGCKTSTGEATANLSSTVIDSPSLPLAKAEFKIKGMHCTGCENTIKVSVKELKGVSLVEASFKDNRAVVSFDSTKTNEKAIVAAIQDAGYKVDTFMRK